MANACSEWFPGSEALGRNGLVQLVSVLSTMHWKPVTYGWVLVSSKFGPIVVSG